MAILKVSELYSRQFSVVNFYIWTLIKKLY